MDCAYHGYKKNYFNNGSLIDHMFLINKFENTKSFPYGYYKFFFGDKNICPPSKGYFE